MNAPRKPNLFLVGAPKCGTSALYSYLRAHPSVYMSHVKEPHFFCTDFPGLRRFPSDSEYVALFGGATENHTLVGEATSRYLYSRTAIAAMEQFQPAAKYIVMLRNPVELVHSLHGQLHYQFTEDEPDFETAWRLQEAREGGDRIPAACPCVNELFYGQVARLGEQVERLFQHVPRERVHLIFYDDFRDDLPGVYGDVLKYLGLDDDGRREFPRVNPHKGYRSKLLARLIVNPPFPLSTLKQALKKSFGWKETQVGRWLYARITVPTRREPMSRQLRDELTDVFYDDIRLLEELSGRSLDHWYASRQTPAVRAA